MNKWAAHTVWGTVIKLCLVSAVTVQLVGCPGLGDTTFDLYQLASGPKPKTDGGGNGEPGDEINQQRQSKTDASFFSSPRQDIDECAAGTHTCNITTEICMNLLGSYTCVCAEGYQRDGNNVCVDVDECTVGTHTCDAVTETCMNTAGSYTCVCAEGYQRDGNNVCVDVDECTVGTHTCDAVTETCMNTAGSYTCACAEGYQHDSPLNIVGIFRNHHDIPGHLTPSGSTHENNDAYTVKGAGSDIWHASDQFHYVYEKVSGDVEIIASVVSVENTHEWAKAGIMIRDSLNPDAKFVFVLQRPDNRVAMQWRTSTGALAGYVFPKDNTVMSKYLRLTRSGDTYHGFYSINSPNGPWISLGMQTVAMSGNDYVGLAVTSHNPGSLTTAVFDSVSVNGHFIE
ncbi:MAG: hypothetical protein AAF471_01255 [Myxococcota bacterium]